MANWVLCGACGGEPGVEVLFGGCVCPSQPSTQAVRWGFIDCPTCGLMHCGGHKATTVDAELKILEAKLDAAVDTFMAAWMEWKAAREGMR